MRVGTLTTGTIPTVSPFHVTAFMRLARAGSTWGLRGVRRSLSIHPIAPIRPQTHRSKPRSMRNVQAWVGGWGSVG
jgi:hypothetical protein